MAPIATQYLDTNGVVKCTTLSKSSQVAHMQVPCSCGGHVVPSSPSQIMKNPLSKFLYRDSALARGVIRLCEGIVLKFCGEDISEEILCTKYARSVAGLPSVPSLVYAPEVCSERSPYNFLHPPSIRPPWFFTMEEVRGVRLDSVVDELSDNQIRHVAHQLRDILSSMKSLSSPVIASVDGGPFRNCWFQGNFAPPRAFASVSDSVDYLRSLLIKVCGESNQPTVAYIDHLFSPIPRNAEVVFTHGDFVPKNILVHGSTITGILDWAEGGFYPDFWEYCRMHDPDYDSKGWRQILSLVHSEPERVDMIWAFKQIYGMISSNYVL